MCAGVPALAAREIAAALAPNVDKMADPCGIPPLRCARAAGAADRLSNSPTKGFTP
jgi:hypothetical protein